MAIIKTLLLQAFILLALCGAVQSQLAEKPTFKAEIGTVDETGKTVSECDKAINLTCTKSEKSNPTQAMTFTKDTKAIKWVPKTDFLPNGDIKTTLGNANGITAAEYGVYKCKAASTYSVSGGHEIVMGESDPSEGKVTIDCKKCTDNATCTKNDEHSHCKNGECACKYGGDYGACKICKEVTNEGCTEEGKPRCDSGKSCEQCKLAPSNDGCKGKTAVCLVDAVADISLKTYKCYPCTKSTDPNNGCKDGTYCQKDGSCTADKPSGGDKSSAGIVTSTACLVIASVVVALMN